MPISGHGWELLIERHSVQNGPVRPRTVGRYQAYRDGVAVPGLAGTTAECGGPSSNTIKKVRVLPGRYALATQDGTKYKTIRYADGESVNVNPKPGIELLGTAPRAEILIHPGKNSFLSAIGCINLCTRLPHASEPIDYPGSRRRVIALIEDMKAYLGPSFPSSNGRTIPNAHVVIEEMP